MGLLYSLEPRRATASSARRESVSRCLLPWIPALPTEREEPVYMMHAMVINWGEPLNGRKASPTNYVSISLSMYAYVCP